MGILTTNFHTHTYRCQHADGDVADYCREAVRQGLTTLGFSDHTPLPDGRWGHVRMAMDELPGYLDAIRAARAAFPGLRIPAGLECEYDDGYAAFYRDELLGRRGLEYLVGAVHWYPFHGAWEALHHVPPRSDAARMRAYADYFIRSMESGLFAFMAHPDVFGMLSAEWTDNETAASRDMLAAAATLRVPLELNAYGLRKPPLVLPGGTRPLYPWLPFWELAAEYDVAVVLSADAHRPCDVTGRVADVQAIAERFGLRVVEPDVSASA